MWVFDLKKRLFHIDEKAGIPKKPAVRAFALAEIADYFGSFGGNIDLFKAVAIGAVHDF